MREIKFCQILRYLGNWKCKSFLELTQKYTLLSNEPNYKNNI